MRGWPYLSNEPSKSIPFLDILSKALLGALFFRKLLKEAKKDRVTCDGFEEEASFYEKLRLKNFLPSE